MENLIQNPAMCDARLSARFFREEDDPALAGQAFRFRNELFCEQHGWQIDVKNGMEKDSFDTSRTVHCALLSGKIIAAYFRANRCDRTPFSRSVFPYLATQRSYPISADYWDISRFGIDYDYRYLSTFLYGLTFRFALNQDAKGLVCIISPARERQLASLGLKIRRYGPPTAIDINSNGKAELAMAGEIPLTEQNFSIVRPMVDLTRHMEITDDTFIFRSGHSAA